MYNNQIESIPEIMLLTKKQGANSSATGVFACDLLSHVMGFANEGNILITVLNNINVLGVASLLDLNSVIFSYGISVNDEIIKKANELNIPLYKTKLSTSDIVIKLHNLEE
jgi:predicted transcriptional regulator